MSFMDCIDNAVAAGKIKKETAKKVREAHERAIKENIAKGMMPDEAADKAAISALDKISKQTYEEKIGRLKDMRTAYRLNQMLQNSTLPVQEKMWEVQRRIEARHRNRAAEFNSYITDLIEKYRPKAAGMYQNVRDADNIVREMAGESTDDAAAKEFADIIKKANEQMMDAANRAGANVQPNEKWWWPMINAKTALYKNQSQWVNDHMEWVDWEHTKQDNGDSVLPEERRDFLIGSFRTLYSSGANKEPGKSSDSIAASMSYRKKIFYKDADSFLAANKAYGDGSVIDQYIAHVDHMARNVALMDILGRSPTAGKNYMTGLLKNEAENIENGGKFSGRSPLDKTNDEIHKFDDAWDLYMHGNRTSASNLLSSVGGTIRIFQNSVLLSGTAPISVSGDLVRSMNIAMYNKMSPMRYVDHLTKTIAGGSHTRQELTRMGLVVESALERNILNHRVMGFNEGAKWARYINDVVMRATLLAPLTNISRSAAATHIAGEMADNVGKSFDALSFRETLEKYNITSDDWDVVRKLEIKDPGGMHVLDINSLRNTDVGISKEKARDISDKFMDMIFSERARMVIESTARARSAFFGASPSGTWRGQFGRSVGMFKTFPTSLIFGLMEDVMRKKTLSGKMGHIAATFLFFTTLGAMQAQLKELKDGRDPLNMNDPKFLAKSILQGMAIPVLGDYLFSDVNEYGKGIGKVLTGPQAQFVEDAVKLTLGNIEELIMGKETHFAKEASKFAMGNIPGSKFWLWNAYFKRAIADQVHLWADPAAARESFKTQQRNRQKNYNQQMFWKPGDKAPSRKPDFSRAWQPRTKETF